MQEYHQGVLQRSIDSSDPGDRPPAANLSGRDNRDAATVHHKIVRSYNPGEGLPSRQ